MQSNQWISSEDIFCPHGKSGNLRRPFGVPCHSWWVCEPPAADAERPELLLNILQGTGQTPTKITIWARNVNSAEVEKPWAR